MVETSQKAPLIINCVFSFRVLFLNARLLLHASKIMYIIFKGNWIKKSFVVCLLKFKKFLHNFSNYYICHLLQIIFCHRYQNWFISFFIAISYRLILNILEFPFIHMYVYVSKKEFILKIYTKFWNFRIIKTTSSIFCAH